MFENNIAANFLIRKVKYKSNKYNSEMNIKST